MNSTKCLFVRLGACIYAGILLSSAMFGATAANAEPATMQPTVVVRLDGESWLLATDPKNVGREEKWFERPVAEAKTTRVPWVIQDAFPDYHGVAWYWCDFTVPPLLETGGRYLLRFKAVDYMAEVYVNGAPVGGHEGGETPLVLDVTDAVKSDATNRLAVRVLSPTYEPIDGIALKQTPSGAKQYPVVSNATYSSGGIVDSVELLVTPAVRVEDLYVVPDWKTGEIRVRVNVRNAGAEPLQSSLQLTAAPAAGGETLAVRNLEQILPPGDTVVESVLRIESHRLWDLKDPYLYRIAAGVKGAGSVASDERSARCGFRDFRFENSYFRLNGKRVFLHGNIFIPHYPMGYTCPPDTDMLRRDVLNMKVAGVNLCRITFGGSVARLIDVCDELGMLVVQSHYGNWQLRDGSQMKQRYDRSLSEIVLRDRNHPSVVAWEFLNEIGGNDPVFALAVAALPMIRQLDEQRMCILNSGRFDGDPNVGSLCNPGSQTWGGNLSDAHAYPPFRMMPRGSAAFATSARWLDA